VRFLDLFPDCLKCLRLDDCAKLMHFDVLLKFTLDELHLSSVQIDEEFLDSFVQVLSPVSFLTLQNVIFPNSSRLFQTSDGAPLQFGKLKQLVFKPLQQNQVNLLKCIPSVEKLELENPIGIVCDVVTWRTEMFPNLRQLLLHPFVDDWASFVEVAALKNAFEFLEHIERKGVYVWRDDENDQESEFFEALERVAGEWCCDKSPQLPAKRKKTTS
jgi:hypothetical protein